MALPATEDFAGSAGALGPAWQQAFSASPINRSGGGVGQASSVGSPADAYYVNETFDTAQYSQLQVATFGGSATQLGLVLQGWGTGSVYAAYRCYIDSFLGACIDRVENNTPVNVVRNSGISAVAGDILRAEYAVDGTVSLFQNGTLIATWTDPIPMPGGSPGIYINILSGIVQSGQVDNWEGGNLGSVFIPYSRLQLNSGSFLLLNDGSSELILASSGPLPALVDTLQDDFVGDGDDSPVNSALWDTVVVPNANNVSIWNDQARLWADFWDYGNEPELNTKAAYYLPGSSLFFKVDASQMGNEFFRLVFRPTQAGGNPHTLVFEIRGSDGLVSLSDSDGLGAYINYTANITSPIWVKIVFTLVGGVLNAQLLTGSSFSTLVSRGTTTAPNLDYRQQYLSFQYMGDSYAAQNGMVWLDNINVASTSNNFSQAVGDGAVTMSGGLARLLTIKKAPIGALTPAGVLTKQARRALIGSVTPAGTVTRRTGKVLIASLTPAGVLTSKKQLNRLLTGTLTPAATTTTIKAKNWAVVGSLTLGGTISKAGRKVVIGTLTPAGILARQGTKLFLGTLTPTATTTKQGRKAISGTITSTGTVARKAQKALIAAVIPSALVARFMTRALAGSIAPSGTVTSGKAILRALAGAVTSAGAVTTARRLARAVNGTLASGVGVLIRQVRHMTTGAATSAGVVSRQTTKTLTGQVASAGAVARLKVILRSYTGGVTSGGVVVRRATKVLLGGVTPGPGNAVRRIVQAMVAGMTPAGVTLKRAPKVVTGATTPGATLQTQRSAQSTPQAVQGGVTMAGTIARQISAVRSGLMAPGASVLRLVSKRLTGGATPTGIVSRTAQRLRSMTGAVVSAGTATLLRVALRTMTGGIAPSAVVARFIGRALTGNVSASGNMTKKASKTFTGTQASIGALLKVRGRPLVGNNTPHATIVRLTGRTVLGVVHPVQSLQLGLRKTLTSVIVQHGDLVKNRPITINRTLAPAAQLTEFAQKAKALTGTVTMAGGVGIYFALQTLPLYFYAAILPALIVDHELTRALTLQDELIRALSPETVEVDHA